MGCKHGSATYPPLDHQYPETVDHIVDAIAPLMDVV